MPSDPVPRYLRLLGVTRREPGLDALGELVRAHVERVPFENISKLYRFRRSGLIDVPDIDEFLEGIERLGLGGTCYANNVHLHTLLVALGFHARLCGADMSRPDVHVVNVVELDGREFLVDVGYGAPFFAPMPLDVARDQVIALGHDRYVLRPRDAEGRPALELHRDGKLRHGYRVRPTPRDRQHFQSAITDSFRPDATFMKVVVLIRFSAGRAVAIRNLSLVESWGDQEHRRSLADDEELARAAEATFGVPREVTKQALTVAADLASDPWA